MSIYIKKSKIIYQDIIRINEFMKVAGYKIIFKTKLLVSILIKQFRKRQHLEWQQKVRNLKMNLIKDVQDLLQKMLQPY